jgi:pimeloyl-ACP methyl ester carboxylesterase
MSALDLAAQTIGAGPPVIILHGLFGSQRNWGGIARALSDDFTINGLDLRNHGDSPWAPTMTYDEMAADVITFIQTSNLDSVAILGHSMGGKVAMRVAMLRPDLVRRLIIVDIAPVPYYNETYSVFIDAMLALDLKTIARLSEADQALAPVIAIDSLRAFLLQNLVSEDGHFRWRLNLADIGRNMPALIGFPGDGSPYAGATVFIAGEKSNYIRPRDKDRIMTLFPAANLLEIADCGHWPHAEHPERFLAMVRPLLLS